MCGGERGEREVSRWSYVAEEVYCGCVWWIVCMGGRGYWTLTILVRAKFDFKYIAS